MRNGIICLAVAWFSFQLALAEDFEKSYEIPADSVIIIDNSLGSIKVTSHKGKEVELTAYKKGPGSDLIEIKEDQAGEKIKTFSLKAQFAAPKPLGQLPMFGGAKRSPPKMFSPPIQPVSPSRFPVPRASVDFEVRIPKSVKYRQIVLSTFSGNGKVELSEIKGNFRIMSRTGSVEVRDVKGVVTATSLSGTIDGYLVRSNEPSYLSFSSTSGNVLVQAPANLNATIEMRSQSGSLKTDFPLEIKEDRYGPGKFVSGGKLGNGSDKLRIYSNFGKVSLVHSKDHSEN
jgi:hypothetical protein